MFLTALTRLGLMITLDTSTEALEKFGVTAGTFCLTPLGLGFIAGLGEDTKGNTQLWFALEVNQWKVSFWDKITNKTTLYDMMTIDSELLPLTLEQLVERIPNCKVNELPSIKPQAPEELQEEDITSQKNNVDLEIKKKDLEYVDPKVIFRNFIAAHNLIKQKKSRNLFSSIQANKLFHQDKARLSWMRALEFVKEGQFVNAVFCCAQGYQASYFPLNSKLEANLDKLSKTYSVNGSYQHIEFARLEASIIQYLIAACRYNDLFQLVQFGNELALKFFIIDKDTEKFVKVKADVLAYIKSKKETICNSEIKTIIELGLEFKENFAEKFNEAVIYLDNIGTPALKLFLRAIMVHFIITDYLNNKKYLNFLKNFLDDINNNPDIHYLYPRMLSNTNLLNYTGLKIKDINLTKKKYLQLSILNGDVYCNSDSSALCLYITEISEVNVGSLKPDLVNFNFNDTNELHISFNPEILLEAMKAIENNPIGQLIDALEKVHNYENEGIKIILPLLKAILDSRSNENEEIGDSDNDNSDNDADNVHQITFRIVH